MQVVFQVARVISALQIPSHLLRIGAAVGHVAQDFLEAGSVGGAEHLQNPSCSLLLGGLGREGSPPRPGAAVEVTEDISHRGLAGSNLDSFAYQGPQEPRQANEYITYGWLQAGAKPSAA